MHNSALVIIDMQNDFVLPTILQTNQRAFDIVPNVQKILFYARAQNIPVFHIVREYRSDASNIEFIRIDDFSKRPRAVPSKIGYEIVKELTLVDGEYRLVHGF